MSPSFDVVRAELESAVAGASHGNAAADRLCVACVGLFGVDGAAVSVVHRGVSQGTFGASDDASRRMDEYQFTYGEGPCLDAVATGRTILVPDLDDPRESRWPGFARAALDGGIRGVFALPVVVTSVRIGALDLFRSGPGPLLDEHLVGALLAAQMASLALLQAWAGEDDLDGRLLREGEDAWGDLAEADRIEVYQATGMLIAQLGVDAGEALLRMRAHAVATGQTASEVAWAIIERRLVLDADPRPKGRERRRL